MRKTLTSRTSVIYKRAIRRRQKTILRAVKKPFRASLSINSDVKNDIILRTRIIIEHLAQLQQMALCGHKKLFER